MGSSISRSGFIVVMAWGGLLLGATAAVAQVPIIPSYPPRIVT